MADDGELGYRVVGQREVEDVSATGTFGRFMEVIIETIPSGIQKTFRFPENGYSRQQVDVIARPWVEEIEAVQALPVSLPEPGTGT